MNSGQDKNGGIFPLGDFRMLHPVLVWAIFTLLVLIGILRIVSTYPILSQVLDEPASVASGMEWLDKGTYTYEPMHPPLARVMAAVGPYLKGARSLGRPSVWREGNAILHHDGNYWTNLSLARAGILPFFILGSLIVFLWARELIGDGGALIATGLFTTMPPVLAHAGFATLDMAQVATVLLALYLYNRLLQNPSLLRALCFGSACGVAVLTKFTAGLFLVTAILIHIFTGALLNLVKSGQKTEVYRPRSPLLIATIILSSFLVIWCGYRFSFGPIIETGQRPFTTMAGTVGVSPAGEERHDDLSDIKSILNGLSLPAPELFQGVKYAKLRDRFENFSYLFGRIRKGGWWYYFPATILFKTPLPILVLALVGILAILRNQRTRLDANYLMMWIYPLSIILVLLPSQVNNGVRQILVIYGFFSILGAMGVLTLLSLGVGFTARRGLLTILLAWYLFAGIAIHPDYVAYFNELAGKRPENILIESDLDWGQDLARLMRTVKKMGIEVMYLQVITTAELYRFPLPRLRNLEPMTPVTGWVAVGMWPLKFYNIDRYSEPPFEWLENYTPVKRIGRSILLYYIPEKMGLKENFRLATSKERAG